MRCSLSRYLGRTATSDAELRAMAAAAWHQRGIVVLFPDQQINWTERGLIEAAAVKLYGPRSNGDKNENARDR